VRRRARRPRPPEEEPRRLLLPKNPSPFHAGGGGWPERSSFEFEVRDQAAIDVALLGHRRERGVNRRERIGANKRRRAGRALKPGVRSRCRFIASGTE
jgi:hypothetical protein